MSRIGKSHRKSDRPDRVFAEETRAANAPRNRGGSATRAPPPEAMRCIILRLRRTPERFANRREGHVVHRAACPGHVKVTAAASRPRGFRSFLVMRRTDSKRSKRYPVNDTVSPTPLYSSLRRPCARGGEEVSSLATRERERGEPRAHPFTEGRVAPVNSLSSVILAEPRRAKARCDAPFDSRAQARSRPARASASASSSDD